MTSFLLRAGKLTGKIGAALCVALLVWANWQAPDLHSYAPTTRITVLRVGGLTEPSQAAAIDHRLRALDGITACNLNPTTQLAVVSYNPDQLTERDVSRALAAGGAYLITRPAPIATAGPAAPQCPVPASYITALNQLRFALNFRRLFVHGV